MKASDLRPPNLILWNGTQVCFSEVMEEMIHGLREDEAEGIPLTEDWLLRLGFVLSNKANYITTDFNEYTKGDVMINDVFTVFVDYDILYSELETKHVHQLQNIYHSLTGEELTI